MLSIWNLPIWVVEGHVRSKAISCEGHGGDGAFFSLYDNQGLAVIIIREAKRFVLPHPHILVSEVVTNTASVLRREGPASSEAVGQGAEGCALSRLARMPAEIRRIVWSFSGEIKRYESF